LVIEKGPGQKIFVPVDSSCLLYGKKWFQRVNTKTYVGGIESPLVKLKQTCAENRLCAYAFGNAGTVVETSQYTQYTD
jgi:hypothetical protein